MYIRSVDSITIGLINGDFYLQITEILRLLRLAARVCAYFYLNMTLRKYFHPINNTRFDHKITWTNCYATTLPFLEINEGGAKMAVLYLVHIHIKVESQSYSRFVIQLISTKLLRIIWPLPVKWEAKCLFQLSGLDNHIFQFLIEFFQCN